MTTATVSMTAAPAPLSGWARLASAVAVVGFVIAAWQYAGHESQHAVQSSTAALSSATAPVTHVTLPTVEIVGRREGAAVASIAASASDSGRDRLSSGQAL